MGVNNKEVASSAIYHIEAIERRLTILKEYIHEDDGSVDDKGVALGLVDSIDIELTDLQNDLVKLI